MKKTRVKYVIFWAVVVTMAVVAVAVLLPVDATPRQAYDATVTYAAGQLYIQLTAIAGTAGAP